MLPLKELQTLFQQALLKSYGPQGSPEAAEPFLSQVISTPALTAQKRLKIYSGSYFANISDALKVSYPVCAKIFGEDFYEIAYCYVRQHPSTQQNLNHYGALFADFLQAQQLSLPSIAHHPLIPDLARLEWLWDQAHISTDDQPVDLVAALSKLDEEQYGQIRFCLSYSAQMLHSCYPIRDIWLQESLPSTLPPAGSYHYLVRRVGHERIIDELTAEQQAFLLDVKNGITFGILSQNHAVDRLLPEAVVNGWLVGLKMA